MDAAMFDLAGQRRWSPAQPAASARRSRVRCMPRARRVALTGTRAAVLEALAGELGERAHAVPADLSREGAGEGLSRRRRPRMGRVDILVNNAGITRDKLVMRMKDADWDEVLAVESHRRLPAVAGRAARHDEAALGADRQRSPRWSASPGMPARPIMPPPRPGLIGMSKALAQEVAGRGITVNCVAPGFIETAMTDVLDDKQPGRGSRARSRLGRLGMAEEMAAAVVFLALRARRPTSPARPST